MKLAKGLSAIMLFSTVVAFTSGCVSKKQDNNEVDLCKQVIPAPYPERLHFRVINELTGTDLMAESTPNRFTFDQLASTQFCNDQFVLEEARQFYKDAAGKDCVVFWFANLNAPDAYDPQECRRIIMRWSHTDTDTLEWTTHVQSNDPRCDSFEVLDKVFFNNEVVPPVTQDGQTFYPLYKTN
jgi:hypothetical protein